MSYQKLSTERCEEFINISISHADMLRMCHEDGFLLGLTANLENKEKTIKLLREQIAEMCKID